MTSTYSSRLRSFVPSCQEIDDFVQLSKSEDLLNAFNRLTIWCKLLYDVRSEEETSVLLASCHSKIIEIW